MVCWFRSRSRRLKESLTLSRVSQSASRSSWAQAGRTSLPSKAERVLWCWATHGSTWLRQCLREDEQEPDGQDLTRRERPFPVAWGGEEAVQGGRQVQTLKRGPQDRQVGH